jgi:hypothetical protein
MKAYFTVFFCVLIVAVSAQSFDEIVSSNRYIDCRDVTFNSNAIIKRLYSNNQIDSIFQFLEYWEKKCGPMEPALRLKNILKIKNKEFEPNSISSSLIEQMLHYIENQDFFYIPNQYYQNQFEDDFAIQRKAYDSLTRRFASDIISENLDESLLLDFYSNDSPHFEKIKLAPEQSRLKQLRQEIYSKTRSMPQYHLAFVTGISQHYGNISVFGVRPNFGMIMGARRLKHNYDMILDFRAGPAKESYSFIYQDSLFTNNSYTGMYFGFEYTFDFVNTPKFDIGISPAMGYDRITTLTVDNDYGEEARFLSSFNKNIGVVLKYKYGSGGRYIGLHVRYNFTDYKNPGGTRLNGEYLNIRFTIGSVSNYWRDRKLKYLE